MAASDLFDEALKLEVDDRLRLLELLCDSLASQPERVVVTEAQPLVNRS